MSLYWKISGSNGTSEKDCLQSAFSLKIRLVLISSSAIANHDVIITIRDLDQTRKDGLLFFLLGLTPSFLAAPGFAARVLRLRVAVTLQIKLRDSLSKRRFVLHLLKLIFDTSFRPSRPFFGKWN